MYLMNNKCLTLLMSKNVVRHLQNLLLNLIHNLIRLINDQNQMEIS